MKNSSAALNYRTPERVTSETIYDLASLTKVSATLQAIMLLYDRKQITLDDKASAYLPELTGTNKANFTIRDLLLHRSGLVSFYPPLWDRTKTSAGGLLPEYYSSKSDTAYYLQVAPKLFAKGALRDSVWKWVVESPMNNRKDRSGSYGYLYSDLGFLTLQKIVEKVTASLWTFLLLLIFTNRWAFLISVLIHYAGSLKNKLPLLKMTTVLEDSSCKARFTTKWRPL
jgi:beta-N-acetylhexosaminidase